MQIFVQSALRRSKATVLYVTVSVLEFTPGEVPPGCPEASGLFYTCRAYQQGSSYAKVIVIVIGCGVIGLSTARCLQEAGYSVDIITRELPQHTTSIAAGAVWSGSELEGRRRGWAGASLVHFLKLTQAPGSGVTLQRMREVFKQAVPDPWYRDRLSFFERIPRAKLPKALVDGYMIDVPMVAPPLYLQNLHDQFIAAGGNIEQRTVASLDELEGAAPLLVNCSGVGARELAEDEAVYPIRGQTMLIDAPEITIGYMDNDSIDHVFPRGDGVLIGGVKLAGDWNRALDPAISADIIARTAKIEPGIAEATVLRQFTGLRPGRAEVRLEAERLSDRSTVIHNYGHAAVGYTLSWGCAEEVLALARKTEAI